MENTSHHISLPPPRFVFKTIGREREKTVPEIIKGYIPMGLKGLFFGDEKTFKTPVAVKIGVDVAMPCVTHHGDPTYPGLGYDVLRHGAVRYIAAELPKGIHTRAREYISAREPNADPRAVDFLILDGKPDLTARPDVHELIEALDASLGDEAVMRLIFIDTTVFCLGDSDENHPSTVTRAYNAADEIIAHYDGACSVIFILHTGKNESRGVRGSSNWEKSVGFRLEFSAKGSIKELEEGRTITYPELAVVSSKKNKDGPYQQAIHYKVTRKIFEAYETDPVFEMPQPIKDSVLHLAIVPETKPSRTQPRKNDKSGKQSHADIKEIIAVLVSMIALGKRFNIAMLANLADENNMLDGKPKTRRANFVRKVHRYMRAHSADLNSKWFTIHTAKTGKHYYWFLGQQGN